MELRPEDFGFRYAWREGSLPPPHHYEYTIAVTAEGLGTIVFHPDYPEHGGPVWEERFQVSVPQLDELHALMLGRGVFADAWEPDPDPPVGGSLEWLEVTADGRRHLVPSTLRRPEAVEPVYRLIRALVPAPTWADLMARLKEHQDAYQDP